MIADKGILSTRSVYASKPVYMEHVYRKFCLCFCDYDLLCGNRSVKSLPMALRSLLRACPPKSPGSWGCLLGNVFPSLCGYSGFSSGEYSCAGYLFGFIRDSWYPVAWRCTGDGHLLALELSAEAARAPGETL